MMKWLYDDMIIWLTTGGGGFPPQPLSLNCSFTPRGGGGIPPHPSFWFNCSPSPPPLSLSPLPLPYPTTLEGVVLPLSPSHHITSPLCWKRKDVTSLVVHLYARSLHSTRVGVELVTGKKSNTNVNALNWSDQGKTFVSQPGAHQVHSKKPTAVLPLYLKVNSISKGPPQNICLIGLWKVVAHSCTTWLHQIHLYIKGTYTHQVH